MVIRSQAEPQRPYPDELFSNEARHDDPSGPPRYLLCRVFHYGAQPQREIIARFRDRESASVAAMNLNHRAGPGERFEVNDIFRKAGAV